jgi:phosphatidylethanolamine-binding protein (PEBP) family uncharacterized protein
MKLSFTWGDIPLCTSGRPNVVPSPEFVLTRVPEGTERVEFKLTDLDVPGYNHGGGTVSVSQDGTVPSGAFTYKSPCPPNGVHSYEWRAIALGAGMILAEAAAQRPYPE